MSVDYAIRDFKEIIDELCNPKEFKGDDLLKIYEIAAQIQRNKIEKERNVILEKAFCICENEPVALEAIAMVLGYKKNGNTIVDALNSCK